MGDTRRNRIFQPKVSGTESIGPTAALSSDVSNTTYSHRFSTQDLPEQMSTPRQLRSIVVHVTRKSKRKRTTDDITENNAADDNVDELNPSTTPGRSGGVGNGTSHDCSTDLTTRADVRTNSVSGGYAHKHRTVIENEHGLQRNMCVPKFNTQKIHITDAQVQTSSFGGATPVSTSSEDVSPHVQFKETCIQTVPRNRRPKGQSHSSHLRQQGQQTIPEQVNFESAESRYMADELTITAFDVSSNSCYHNNETDARLNSMNYMTAKRNQKRVHSSRQSQNGHISMDESDSGDSDTCSSSTVITTTQEFSYLEITQQRHSDERQCKSNMKDHHSKHDNDQTQVHDRGRRNVRIKRASKNVKSASSESLLNYVRNRSRNNTEEYPVKEPTVYDYDRSSLGGRICNWFYPPKMLAAPPELDTELETEVVPTLKPIKRPCMPGFMYISRRKQQGEDSLETKEVEVEPKPTVYDSLSDEVEAEVDDEYPPNNSFGRRVCSRYLPHEPEPEDTPVEPEETTEIPTPLPCDPCCCPCPCNPCPDQEPQQFIEEKVEPEPDPGPEPVRDVPEYDHGEEREAPRPCKRKPGSGYRWKPRRQRDEPRENVEPYREQARSSADTVVTRPSEPGFAYSSKRRTKLECCEKLEKLLERKPCFQQRCVPGFVYKRKGRDDDSCDVDIGSDYPSRSQIIAHREGVGEPCRQDPSPYTRNNIEVTDDGDRMQELETDGGAVNITIKQTAPYEVQPHPPPPPPPTSPPRCRPRTPSPPKVVPQKVYGRPKLHPYLFNSMMDEIENARLRRKSRDDSGLSKEVLQGGDRPSPVDAQRHSCRNKCVRHASPLPPARQQQIVQIMPCATEHNTPYASQHNTPYVSKHNTPHASKHNTPYISKRNTPYQSQHNTPHASEDSTSDFNTPYASQQDTLYLSKHNTPRVSKHTTPYESQHSTPHSTPYASQYNNQQHIVQTRNTPHNTPYASHRNTPYASKYNTPYASKYNTPYASENNTPPSLFSDSTKCFSGSSTPTTSDSCTSDTYTVDDSRNHSSRRGSRGDGSIETSHTQPGSRRVSLPPLGHHQSQATNHAGDVLSESSISENSEHSSRASDSQSCEGRRRPVVYHEASSSKQSKESSRKTSSSRDHAPDDDDSQVHKPRNKSPKSYISKALKSLSMRKSSRSSSRSSSRPPSSTTGTAATRTGETHLALNRHLENILGDLSSSSNSSVSSAESPPAKSSQSDCKCDECRTHFANCLKHIKDYKDKVAQFNDKLDKKAKKLLSIQLEKENERLCELDRQSEIVRQKKLQSMEAREKVRQALESPFSLAFNDNDVYDCSDKQSQAKECKTPAIACQSNSTDCSRSTRIIHRTAEKPSQDKECSVTSCPEHKIDVPCCLTSCPKPKIDCLSNSTDRSMSTVRRSIIHRIASRYKYNTSHNIDVPAPCCATYCSKPEMDVPETCCLTSCQKSHEASRLLSFRRPQESEDYDTLSPEGTTSSTLSSLPSGKSPEYYLKMLSSTAPTGKLSSDGAPKPHDSDGGPSRDQYVEELLSINAALQKKLDDKCNVPIQHPYNNNHFSKLKSHEGVQLPRRLPVITSRSPTTVGDSSSVPGSQTVNTLQTAISDIFSDNQAQDDSSSPAPKSMPSQLSRETTQRYLKMLMTPEQNAELHTKAATQMAKKSAPCISKGVSGYEDQDIKDLLSLAAALQDIMKHKRTPPDTPELLSESPSPYRSPISDDQQDINRLPSISSTPRLPSQLNISAPPTCSVETLSKSSDSQIQMAKDRYVEAARQYVEDVLATFRCTAQSSRAPKETDENTSRYEDFQEIPSRGPSKDLKTTSNNEPPQSRRAVHFPTCQKRTTKQTIEPCAPKRKSLEHRKS